MRRGGWTRPRKRSRGGRLITWCPVSVSPRLLNLLSELCRQSLQHGPIHLEQHKKKHIVENNLIGRLLCCCSVKHNFLPILTCDGEGISILKLRRARECFGVFLHACWSRLVPGTGSGGDRRRGDGPGDGTVVS